MKFWHNTKIREEKGMTLVELMISTAAGLATTMVFLSLFSLGTDLFNAAIEQIQTEESLTNASYYLKAVLSQAVKVSCCTGAACGGGGPNSAIPFPTYNLAVTANEPAGVGEGKVDCRDGNPANYTGARENALGIFVRDVGALNGGFQAASDYKGTAIYFVPPVNDTPSSMNGLNSGRLVMKEGTPGGGAFNTLIAVDRLVDIGVLPGSQDVAPTGYLRSISYKVTARYFSAGSGVVGRHYRATGGVPTARYRDLETTVKVVFRNNRLGDSMTNGITSERPLGQIYFFRFVAPHLGAL